MRIHALLLLPLLALAACTAVQNPADAEGNIVSPGNFRAGSGVIESVAVLPGARPRDPAAPAASKGGRAPDPNLYRLFVHMDKGGSQSVDIDNPTFMPGQTVELTNDGRVVRVSGTSLRDALGTR